MKEMIGALIVVATVLFGCTGVLVAVAFSTKKSRLEILKTLRGMSLGRDWSIGIAQLWASFFQRVFGRTLLARRQLISIPLYTLLVSLVFFVVWLLDIYLFKNPEHVFNVPPPPNVLQAIKDFYSKGLLVAIVIDCVTIQLTKWSINVGMRRGFGSWRFLWCFSATIALAYLLFSAAVYWFRWSDMNELYAMLPADEVRPTITFSPLRDVLYSISLFQPVTFIYATSEGLVSSYFMPEPILFYCAVTGTLSLLTITVAYQFARGAELLRRLCMGFVSHVGTPRVNAMSVVFMMLLGLLLVPLCLMALYMVV
ncbi:hypothetical protein JTY93_04900 [Pseudomonas hygromyciniae]|uniref:Uncharacterized protein n=1 Tax=Pseudomonas hygromyciniae TaxID=2812000 RepID=A0ABX7K1T9_9PSED|nr:hypothetical protein [Pseudomonas hygromyciniae]MBN0980601.1 hypothetical protein [Pseudomonas hygromyciniae]QSB40735.1 hypothetical protein JTY93_04900 [Pseudomonas hygromyciniae]